MSTVIRSELSEKNKYAIPKHRYLELKHFCMQYPEWQRALKELNPLQSSFKEEKINVGHQSDPTGDLAERRLYFTARIRLLEHVAQDASDCYWRGLLEAIVYGYSYDTISARTTIPCCRESWYESYRRFFWLLDKARK